MNKSDYNSKLELIINFYGYDRQLLQLIEECSELITAICHYKRDRKKAENVRDELLDVKILIDQLLVHYLEGEIINMSKFKLDREIERIYELKKKKGDM